MKTIPSSAPSEEDYVSVSPQLKSHKIFVKSGTITTTATTTTATTTTAAATTTTTTAITTAIS